MGQENGFARASYFNNLCFVDHLARKLSLSRENKTIVYLREGVNMKVAILEIFSSMVLVLLIFSIALAGGPPVLPEPATMLLLGTGLAALVGAEAIRRRKK